MNSSPKGESIRTIFKPIFKNMKNMQTCKDLNQIKASKLVQMSSFFSKQDENMVYSYNMDMHVTIYHEFNSKLINSTMHARNELQFTINDPNHDLVLQ